jgi:hypothetical protein
VSGAAEHYREGERLIRSGLAVFARATDNTTAEAGEDLAEAYRQAHVHFAAAAVALQARQVRATAGLDAADIDGFVAAGVL